MTKEEDFFKENFPEYVTEKGECLSPYWDLFRAGVICATFERNIELGKLEGKLADLTSEYYELENLKNNEINKAKEIVKQFLLWENDWHSKTESKYELLNRAEQFLKESE